MKQLFLILFAISLMSYNKVDETLSSPRVNITKDGPSENLKEMHYNAFVAIDRAGYEYYGGTQEKVQEALDYYMARATAYWNESGCEDGEGKGRQRFKNKYKFTGTLGKVYEGSSERYWEIMWEYADSVNANPQKYDFVLFLDIFKDFEGEGGTAGAGGVKDGVTGVNFKANGSERENDMLRNDFCYKTLCHEMGHYRCVTDVYATMATGGWNGNLVNGKDFYPMKCIMWDVTTHRWSDYALRLIDEFSEYKKPGKANRDFFKVLFCDEIKFNIKVNGKRAKSGEIVAKFYGKSAGKRIVNDPFATFKTNNKGVFMVSDVPAMYCDPYNWAGGNMDGKELGWGRWFNMLVTFEKDGQILDCMWIPEYEVQSHGQMLKQISYDINLKL